MVIDVNEVGTRFEDQAIRCKELIGSARKRMYGLTREICHGNVDLGVDDVRGSIKGEGHKLGQRSSVNEFGMVGGIVSTADGLWCRDRTTGND